MASPSQPSLDSIVKAVGITSDILARYRARHQLNQALETMFAPNNPPLPAGVDIRVRKPGDVENCDAYLMLGESCTSKNHFYNARVMWGDITTRNDGDDYTFSSAICTRRDVERDAAVYKVYLFLEANDMNVTSLQNLSILE